MLSFRHSIILTISVSENALVESGCFSLRGRLHTGASQKHEKKLGRSLDILSLYKFGDLVGHIYPIGPFLKQDMCIRLAIHFYEANF
jgi:hypothetical protein